MSEPICKNCVNTGIGLFHEHCTCKHGQEKKLIKERLYNRVAAFIRDNGITCDETIYQCDWVIENAYTFISDLFEIIESDLDIKEEK